NHGVQLTCIEAKESVGEKRTICFDRVTKGLQSVRYSSLLSHWQHEYSQYIAFGGFNFPGRIKSESSDDGSLEIVVTELAPESGSDTTIFAKAPNSAGVPRRHSTATPLSMLAISCIALRTSTPRTILRIRVPMIVRTRSVSHNSSQQIGLCPKSPMKNKFERSKVRSRFRYG